MTDRTVRQVQGLTLVGTSQSSSAAAPASSPNPPLQDAPWEAALIPCFGQVPEVLGGLRAGKVFCLVEAPNADAPARVHKEAHGLVADRIFDVQEGD